MDFGTDAVTADYVARVQAFLNEEVYRAEPRLEEELRAHPDRWSTPEVVRGLRESAKRRNLWNLFLPGSSGLTNVQYAPLAELMGRSPKLAPVAMNCSAPDTGNMEILRDFGTHEQQRMWLDPLLDGSIRSAFCMTEPEVASSDATNIRTRIEADGDSYVVTGRKWWISGALNDEAKIFIVLGKTDPDGPRHRQQSMVLVPRDTPGVRVERALRVFGYDDRDHGGHAEVVFEGVRVPRENIIKGEGEGFAIAQARLGPGRIHHCMRAIGMAERALEIMVARARDREAFGLALARQGVVRQWVAESRTTIESLRLLVLKTAWLMDTVGNKGAHTEIQAIKFAVPRGVQEILDRAIQLLGGGGLSQDHPVSEFYALVRALRLADGPDEVHLASLGRRLMADPIGR